MSTEIMNCSTTDIDLLTIRQIMELINQQDAIPHQAVRQALPDIEPVVAFIVAHFPRGGRLLYVAAGTSGRIAVMDAAECPPTFGILPDRVQVRMAGGEKAIFHAAEDQEDDCEAGRRAVSDWNVRRDDCVIGIAASGRTPYVLSALDEARKKGAYTVLIASNPIVSDVADSCIYLATGPEVLTGSTRMKAGTAAKMVLNMITTTAFLKLGRTFGNRMCYIQASNEKLKTRMVKTISECCSVSLQAAEKLLVDCDGEMAIALIVGLSEKSPMQARADLYKANGFVREAIKL